jgi:CheY-like chemotaxis protein
VSVQEVKRRKGGKWHCCLSSVHPFLHSRTPRGFVAIRPHARIPAVAVTAYAAIGDREAALKAGFNGHVAKPVDPERLIASVAAAIQLGNGSST